MGYNNSNELMAAIAIGEISLCQESSGQEYVSSNENIPRESVAFSRDKERSLKKHQLAW
jgi:hypothetical protein